MLTPKIISDGYAWSPIFSIFKNAPKSPFLNYSLILRDMKI